MIILDMQQKRTIVPIPIGAFSDENNVLTLEIDVGSYDLTGKIISAKFNPAEVESEVLDVVNGVIKLPIYSTYVEPGVNMIQLIFRWNATRIEQSPIMVWIINKSLTSETIAQQDVDIITDLIAQVQALLNTAEIEIAVGTSEPTNKNFWLDTAEV